MNKNIYQFLILLSFYSVLLVISCKKSTEVKNPVFSYGIVGIEPSTLVSGDTVAIYGVGFQPNTSGNTLKINGVNATIITATSTALTAIVPEAPYSSGNVVVQTGSQSFTYGTSLNVLSLVSGSQSGNINFTSDKKYLIRGEVHFIKGSSLNIQPGTTIFGEKNSKGSLIIDDGASIQAKGSPNNPIVFTSDQYQSLRAPGDWGGIILSSQKTSSSTPDQLSFVRIEYAGYHLPNANGAALLVSRSIASNNIQSVQASYSSGDGFHCNINSSSGSNVIYLKYLVAFACEGNDFEFSGQSRILAQFLVGLKDPSQADQYGADGLLVQSSQPVTISNLTLVGYDGCARGVINPNRKIETQYGQFPYTTINAGIGVHIGGFDKLTGAQLNGTLQLLNSAITASYLAGITLEGQPAWNSYGNGSTGSIIKSTSVTYILDRSLDNQLQPPLVGYCFCSKNILNSKSGYASSANTLQGLRFLNNKNDTAQLQLYAYSGDGLIRDNLGIQYLVNANLLNTPTFLPISVSPLLSGANLTDALLNDTFFDHSTTFRGAFGKIDWTTNWCNFQPQITPYI